MSISAFLAVFIGGGLGSVCRYGISLLTMRAGHTMFPYATLAANILSCILMAVALTWFSERITEGSWQRIFLLVGFCGGFSTFSTFSLENFQLMKAGQSGFLLANVLISVTLCMAIFYFFLKRA